MEVSIDSHRLRMPKYNLVAIYLFRGFLALLVGPANSQLINRAPHFTLGSGDMSNFVIPENTPVGTPVYQLKGEDPENTQLFYSISGQYLTVDRLTGVVTLAKPLDRETDNFLEVVISITDQPLMNTEANTISLRRLIPVSDINDNPPIFHNRPYTSSISEAAEIGDELETTTQIIITDNDEGANAEIEISCQVKDHIGDMDACQTFDIKLIKITEGQFQVKIYLKRMLDYETRTSYVIPLLASDISDAPLRAFASVSVNVLDVQDQPPIFVNAPYSATVAENTVEGTPVMKIIARDGDTGDPNPVFISIENDVLDYFHVINEKSGEALLVTNPNPIDRENPLILHNGGVYNFFVKATEMINGEVPSDFSVTQVTIIVSDEDDHIPEFNSAEFNISIPENLDTGSLVPGLSIYVDDIDIGANSRYNLTLRDVFNSKNAFAINPTFGEGRTPIAIKVLNESLLDYDVEDISKRRMSFDIVASVKGEDVSSTRININLLDINDNSPIFFENNLKISVREDVIPETKLSDIAATDKDSGVFGQIEYTLSGFGAEHFSTDSILGGIYVKLPLDYEKQKSFSLTIVAKDGGGRVSTANVFIELEDVNDNAPMFEALEYSRTIREGATSFEPQFLVRATDEDGIEGGGGIIKYSIESDNSIGNTGNVFDIDENTGEILIKNTVTSMDTPRGQYDLVIRATDQGIPPLYNETRVLIRVGVTGNQRPIFKGNYHTEMQTKFGHDTENVFYNVPTNYIATIPENASPGSYVVTVSANDPDGIDSLLTYHIVSGAKDNFAINETSGVISVSSDATLDRDINSDTYKIIVTAVDKGTPIPETASATVNVNIQDVNDKPPIFTTSNTTAYKSERIKIGDIVMRVEATDTDVDALLKYSIVLPIKAFTKSGVQLKSNSVYKYNEVFRIDERTGEIRVNNSPDYSQVAIFILTIRVDDLNAAYNKDLQFDTTEVTIYIQPFKETNPVFTNDGWTSMDPFIKMKIKEEQPVGSTLFVLNAEDPVSGDVVSNFKVVNSETDLIQVDSLSGQVVLLKRLDYEELANPNLTLTVKATSNDGTKYSLATILIEVENINDNAPRFTNNIYKTSVLESSTYPEIIVKVEAMDLDAENTDFDEQMGFAKIRYSLEGLNSDLFIIDPQSGLIQIAPNKTLDREKQSVLRFYAVAVDMPQGSVDQLKSRAEITIDVLDVNDNAPMFTKPSYTAVVPENVNVGLSVINMTATDPDDGLGGEIKYDIMNEGEANGLFIINPKTGEIKTRKLLTGKGRAEPYEMVVRAQDGGDLYTDVNLLMYIGDVTANDGIPLFIKPSLDQVAHISENATIGSLVFQVIASDPDDPSLPSGQLSYTLQDSPDSKAFKIDSMSGVISTQQLLDREKKDVYRVVLIVYDHGEPSQQATRILQINITDVDDHKPRFLRRADDPPIAFRIKEEVPLGSIIGEIAATDEDIGENGAIDYIITSGNDEKLVAINRTTNNRGILYTTGRIDRETIDYILVTVKCFKYGTVPLISNSYNRLDPTEIEIYIKILDVDDHLPEFPSKNVTFSVRLNVPIDSIITKVQAKDVDPEALPIDYSLLDLTYHSSIVRITPDDVKDTIIINKKTGELRNIKSLIHLADGILSFIIRANNSAEENRFSDLRVQLLIVRERDLMRFVFSRGTTEVRKHHPKFAKDLSEALRLSGVDLSLHEPRVMVRDDGSLDFSSTSVCFQLTRGNSPLTTTDMKVLLQSEKMWRELQPIYNSHGVASLDECSPLSSAKASASLTQILVLMVSSLVGVGTLVAICSICILHSRFISKSKKASLCREPSISPIYLTTGPRMYADSSYPSC